MIIGLIQTGGMAQIVTALPIAARYAAQGYQILWPVEEDLLPCLRPVAPYASFVASVAGYDAPLSLLRHAGCNAILCLDRAFADRNPTDLPLAHSLKADEYQYAVAGVSFAEKTKLQLVRDAGCEQAAHATLNITKPYICIDVATLWPAAWQGRYQVIDLSTLRGSPFDWLFTIENAARRVMVSGVFSTLAEQLGFMGDNYLILGPDMAATPVMQNGWRYLPAPGQSDFVPLDGQGWGI